MIRSLMFATAIAAAALPVAASAEVFDVSFEAGPVTDVYRPPYGTTVGTVFTGGLGYNSETNALLGFTFVAPERSFGLADVVAFDVFVFNSAILQFSVDFGRGFISSNNTVVVYQTEAPYGFAYCNGCVSFTSSIAGVPEPESWALMILGFGALGTRLRRRPKVRVAVTTQA